MELGIKGHLTRSEEVIKILKMLGGNNRYTIIGGDTKQFYYINDKVIYNSYIGPDEIEGYIIFTLDDFLEKFPYKVGDKVNVWINHDHFGGHRAELEVAEIKSMRWNSARREVAYRMRELTGEFYKSEIKGKVNDDEENLFHTINEYEEIVEKSFQGGYEKCKLDIQLNGYELPEGYHFTDENGNVIEAKKIKLVKNAPSYPKTYEECCDVIGISRHEVEIDIPQPYQQNMFNLFKLIICRDAYWKIAGEYLELDKPWEPEWNWREYKFCIGTIHDVIEKFHAGNQNCILSFPTEEMRDAFYENFKDLIEKCKELL